MGGVCSALCKAAPMRGSTPVYVFPNSGFICEGRRKVELDRGKNRLQTKPNCEEPTEEAAQPRSEVARTSCPLSNLTSANPKQTRRKLPSPPQNSRPNIFLHASIL